MPKKKFLSRDEILNGGSAKIQEVQRPSGGYIRLREWSGAEQQEIFSQQQKLGDEGSVRFLALVIAHSLVDEKGEALLEGTDEEIDAVMKWPGRDLMAVGRASLALNGMGAEAQEALEKN